MDAVGPPKSLAEEFNDLRLKQNEEEEETEPEKREEDSEDSDEDETATTLTDEQINDLNDVIEGFQLLDQHGIDKENCEDLEDIKERLRLHRDQHGGSDVSGRARAMDLLRGLREEHERRRAELRGLFTDVLNQLEDLDDKVVKHLKTEGVVNEFREDLLKHVYDLKSADCPLLVAGETSSGKSSLLNLLLGDEILPQRLLSCTQVMCKIRYGATPRAKVFNKDGRLEEELTLDPSRPAVDQLSRFIYVDGAQPPYSCVELYLPLDILQTGVSIIDSPGFGESRQLDQVLLDFIANKDVFGFIYVIKSDNAGGVQQDRLARLLAHVVDGRRTHARFDPSAAIFVANRWDLVPRDEREAVREDTLRRLRRSWPNVRDSQLFLMSTKQAWNTQLAGYTSRDFASLLAGIEALIPVGLQRKLQSAHAWLDHVLMRTGHYVAAILTHSRLTKQELKDRHKATVIRLHRLEREADVILRRLDKQLSRSVRDISAALSAHLRSEPAQARMTQWTGDEFPCAHPDDNWVEVEAAIDCLIEERLTDVIRDWDSDEHRFRSAQEELHAAFRREFLLLEGEMNAADQLLTGQVDAQADGARLLEGVSTAEDLAHFSTRKLHQLGAGFLAPVLVPIAIGVMLGAPIFMLWDFKKWRRRSLSQHNIDSYQQDRMLFVVTRGMMILERVSSLENVTDYVTAQLSPLKEVLSQVSSSLPRLLTANRALLAALAEDGKSSREQEDRFLDLNRAVLPALREKVCAFGNIHLREYDVTSAQLEVEPSRRAQPIWTELHPARLDAAAIVTVRRFRRAVSQVHVAREEEDLRRLRHPHVARLIGSWEAEPGLPGFVFEGSLVPARAEFWAPIPRRAHAARFLQAARARRLLEQTAMGLEYMHGRGLVSIELSLDSVQLREPDLCAQLVHVSASRALTLAQELPVGAQVYLSPEVLQGGVYRACADNYALGLMAWELWEQTLAFKDKRELPVSEFKADASQLSRDEVNPFLDIVTRCILPPGEQRMTSTEAVNALRSLKVISVDELEEGVTG